MASKFSKEAPQHSARHCLDALPYRMIVFERSNGRTPLFRVAGSGKNAMGARKALRLAFDIHGADCFYCKKQVHEAEFSVDHVETAVAGNHIQNLVIACASCNQSKANRRIEVYDADAGREWLSALLLQVQDRLNRLGP